MSQTSPDSNNPPLIPEVPTELRKAASQGKLIIFVGAGVSRLLGGPSWEEFANKALSQLANNGCIDFAELEQLKHLDPKKKLSIVMDICEEAKVKLDFKQIVQPEINDHNPPKIYQDLYSIGSAFVTTNYDECLDQVAEKVYPILGPVKIEQAPDEQVAGVQTKSAGKVFFKRDDLTIEKLSRPGNVMHLHGSLREPESMILTTRQYLEHYQDDKVFTFLQELFAQYTVLFVGYGLEEEEILEHIFRKREPKATVQDREKKHFRLFPRFSYQEDLCRHLARYYVNHCKVELVDFLIDKHGRERLVAVVEEWAKQLKPEIRESGYLDKIRIIDEALNDQS